jgi:hypothetical protein
MSLRGDIKMRDGGMGIFRRGGSGRQDGLCRPRSAEASGHRRGRAAARVGRQRRLGGYGRRGKPHGPDELPASKLFAVNLSSCIGYKRRISAASIRYRSPTP